MRRKLLRLTLVFLIALFALPLAAWGLNLARRPPRTSVTEPLFAGVTYQRFALTQPHANQAHVLRVELTTPGVRVFVTPGDSRGGREILAATTSEFLAKYDLQVAVNGGFFEPFSAGEYSLNDYYPHSGDPVTLWGLAIADGTLYSTWEADHPTLCVTAARAFITPQTCPPETTQALSGNRQLVEKGTAFPRPNDTDYNAHPRTAVAVDASGQTLWLIVVDGRQPGYSDGMTLNELTDFLLTLGVEAALNLDGGGSSTMVKAGPFGPQLLNAPIHTRLPLRERPSANQLGIYALPRSPAGP